MNNTILYIVGNGFDIHHGIPTSYRNFKDYLQKHDRHVHDYVEEYLQVNDNWSDLESALAYLDVDTVIDHSSDFLQSYATEKWSDAYHHDYQYEIDNIVSSLSTKLKEHFCDWLQDLIIPDLSDLTCIPLNLNVSAIFLNFNYTSSLQHIYGISEKNILFIHGEADDPVSEIILGHAWNPTEIQNLNDVENPEEMDTRVMEGNVIINEYFRKTFKPTEKIIKSNKQFFESLKDISEIRILGHSLSEVDFKYIEVVSKIVNPGANWIISYYNNYDLLNHKTVMKKLNIKNQEYRKLGKM